MAALKILLVNLFIIVLFVTPIQVTNNLTNQFFLKIFHTKNQSVLYHDKTSKQSIRYPFNHKECDGGLLGHNIKHGIIRGKVEPVRSIPSYKAYQYISSPVVSSCMRTKYSSFTLTTACMIYSLSRNRDKTLRIGIILSTRHLLHNPVKKGNFIKIVQYKIPCGLTIPDICLIHKKAVDRAKPYFFILKHMTIYDMLRAYNIDYIFDSWRYICNINTVNNNPLQFVNEYPIKENEIFNMYNSPQKGTTLIILCHDGDRFVISHIFKNVASKILGWTHLKP